MKTMIYMGDRSKAGTDPADRSERLDACVAPEQEVNPSEDEPVKNAPTQAAEQSDGEEFVTVRYDRAAHRMELQNLMGRYDSQKLSESILKSVEDLANDKDLDGPAKHAARMSLCSIFRLPTDFAKMSDEALADALSSVDVTSFAPHVCHPSGNSETKEDEDEGDDFQEDDKEETWL